jgi:hypothetical protein
VATRKVRFESLRNKLPCYVTDMRISNNYIPFNGHIPQAVVCEVIQDIKSGKRYRQIKEDYAVSLGWISKVKRGEIRDYSK